MFSLMQNYEEYPTLWALPGRKYMKTQRRQRRPLTFYLDAKMGSAEEGPSLNSLTVLISFGGSLRIWTVASELCIELCKMSECSPSPTIKQSRYRKNGTRVLIKHNAAPSSMGRGGGAQKVSSAGQIEARQTVQEVPVDCNSAVGVCEFACHALRTFLHFFI